MIRNGRRMAVTRCLEAVPYPDLELRRGPGFDLLALPDFLPSVISSFFTHKKWDRARVPSLDSPLGGAVTYGLSPSFDIVLKLGSK